MGKNNKTKADSKKVCQWLTSKEGQRKIETASLNSKETINHLKDARMIDAEILHKPFNL